MSDVQAFSVGRANNTPRDAVWKSDYDEIAAQFNELATEIARRLADVPRKEWTESHAKLGRLAAPYYTVP